MARGWLEHLVWWQNEIEQFKGERMLMCFHGPKVETSKDTVINPLKFVDHFEEFNQRSIWRSKMTLVEAKGCLNWSVVKETFL